MKERGEGPPEIIGIIEEYEEPEEAPPRRLGPWILQAVAVLALVILAARLWRLQVVEGARYKELAELNRFRLAAVDAPRGTMYDRKGRILARNEASFTVQVVPAKVPPEREEEILTELAKLLSLPKAALAQALQEGRASPQTPVILQREVPRSATLALLEKLPGLTGVSLREESRRQYPEGKLLAHILGYVGSIPAEEMETYSALKDAQYDPNDTVGRTGIERTYEQELRGRKGQELVEVDVNEQKLHVLGQEASRPGNSLILSIDLELQRATEAALRRGMEKAGSTSAVAIAMDPRNGDILAMVSLPSYDNNLFSRELKPEKLQELLSDPRSPLLNHAIGGQYPPGSTIKPLLAVAALEEGVLDAQTRLNCAGTMLVPNQYYPDDPSKAQPFFCWLKTGHGSIDLEEAIAQSCDIFFYQVGGGYKDFSGLGLARLNRWLESFGWGEPTGIALSGEAQGLVPSAQWKKANYHEQWLLGDTYNASIGQGFVLATPLQLLNAISAIANGGTLYEPRLVREIRDPEGKLVSQPAPSIIRKLLVSKKNLELVRQGMRSAVTRGTAPKAALPSIEVAGKTGTAEYPGPRDAQGNLPTHAWFVAFAPFKNPEVAVVVFIEGGGEGSAVAAPVAREILAGYFGLPLEATK